MLLIAALILELSILDNVLRDMTDTQDKSMYSFNIQGDMYSIQLLGKQYYVEKSSVENILYNIKNTYYSIVDYKDKILNK
ncbi:putative transcriptional regulator [Gottschalkia acidurici 9a]|uniref:Transcriptional regulator n=1 Tax=Gottschalkia acidurici (strain ATCC 7906 / DSM 604 / BCRC 14475 / CIP 104303 / KCTC 5404 / NCIMB 10678 / 9a) TaxID=1128398 RepID=K0AZX9_GOTA9|nr:hypothetical protein [Gottschalkia acidurici]AFS78839.1 putative transcriptional regulator [Gottschalkia acidurici 9a]